MLLDSPPSSVDRVANGRCHPFLFAALKRDPLVEGDDYAYGERGEGDGGLRGGLPSWNFFLFSTYLYKISLQQNHVEYLVNLLVLFFTNIEN